MYRLRLLTISEHHGRPTLQTDNMQSQDRAIYTIVHRAVKTMFHGRLVHKNTIKEAN